MTIHAPIPDFATARRAMVDSQLRPQGVTDHALLQAMGSVEREKFVPADVRPLAYIDRSLALGSGRFLAPPAVLGQLLTQVMPLPGERALVVGAGTGYSAAVLQAIGLTVIALESDSSLAAEARANGLIPRQGPQGRTGRLDPRRRRWPGLSGPQSRFCAALTTDGEANRGR